MISLGHMRTGLALTVAGGLALLAGSAVAADEAARGKVYEGEVLVAAHPPGWELAYQKRAGSTEIREFLPTEQTVDRWTDMLTVVIFHGVKNKAPTDVQAELDRLGRDACPSQLEKRLFAGIERGYPTSVTVKLCGKYIESGMGEVALYKIIQGEDSLYQVFRSWRLPSFAVDPKNLPITEAMFNEWSRFFTKNVYVCDSRKPGSCPAGLKP